MKPIISACYLLFMSISILTCAQDNRYQYFEVGSKYQLIGDSVNLRASSTTQSGIVTKLPIGTTLTILAKTEVTITLSNMKSNWYQVKASFENERFEGYLPGKFIAPAALTDEEPGSIQFVYGIQKIEKRKYFDKLFIQIRSYVDYKETDKLVIEGVGSLSTSNTLKSLGNKGLDNVREIITLDFSDDFCGGAFGTAYIFWDGKKMHHVSTLQEGFDAPCYDAKTYTFPEDEKGQAGKIIYTNESGCEDEEYQEETEKIERHYQWNGEKLVEIKTDKPILIETPDTVFVANTKELLSAIRSNRTIYLKPGDYVLEKPEETNTADKPYARWAETRMEIDGKFQHNLILKKLHDLKLQGTDPKKPPRIISHFPDVTVLDFVRCRNVVLKNLWFGHLTHQPSCSGGVLSLGDCENMTISKCELNGSGYYGFWATQCNNLKFTSSKIIDCTGSIFDIYDCTNTLVTNSEFLNNSGSTHLCSISSSEVTTIKNCIFRGNKMSFNSAIEDQAILYTWKSHTTKVEGCAASKNEMEAFYKHSRQGSAAEFKGVSLKDNKFITAPYVGN